MNILKSIGAVLAGLVVIFVLSYATDFLLEGLGLMPRGSLPMQGAELLIIGILAYRLLYSVVGCYLAARLAPSHPMRHALALGVLGFALSLLGTVTAQGSGPAWYGWTLVVLALPCAWLGGKLFELTSRTPRPA